MKAFSVTVQASHLKKLSSKKYFHSSILIKNAETSQQAIATALLLECDSDEDYSNIHWKSNYSSLLDSEYRYQPLDCRVVPESEIEILEQYIFSKDHSQDLLEKSGVLLNKLDVKPDSFVVASLDQDLHSVYSRVAGLVRDVTGSSVRIGVEWAVTKSEDPDKGYSQYSDDYHEYCKYVTVEKEQILKVL